MKIINKKRKKIFTSRAKYCFSLKHNNTDKKVCILLNKKYISCRAVCMLMNSY